MVRMLTFWENDPAISSLARGPGAQSFKHFHLQGVAKASDFNICLVLTVTEELENK